MGIFNWVRFDPPIPCGTCGEPITEFQSKDGDPLMDTRLIKNGKLSPRVTRGPLYNPVTKETFGEKQTVIMDDDPAMTWRGYTSCPKCKVWNEYKIVIIDGEVKSQTLVENKHD